MTINTSSFGGGGLPKLTPDLLFFDRQGGSNIIYSTATIDASGGLTTALSLTGKYMLNSVGFVNLTNETVTVKLTIDGVIIINNTFTVSGTSISVINTYNGVSATTTLSQMGFTPVGCDSSFLLEIQTATDTSILLQYNVRPIL